MNIFAELKKIWNFIDSMGFPGKPSFEAFVATDGEGRVLVNGREYEKGEAYLALVDINATFMMQIVGSDLHSSANGVVCGTISSTKKIVDAEDEKFFLADPRAAKAWLLAHKIVEEPDGPSFVYYEEDCGNLLVKEKITEENLVDAERMMLGINELEDLS